MAEHYSRHKAAFSPGACLKQYSVEQVLGVGGFGITYLAIDGDLQTQVAIKEYLPNDLVVREGDEVLPKSPESQNAFQWGLSRFLQEGRELAKFRHANIVRVHQMFEANNTAYMVLDYENGDTMEKWLRGLARKPTEGELRDILIPLLGALEHIHQGGLLHRDISPDNIIIRKNGAPVLLDFGSARYATAAESKTLSALIKAGYSPPEQYSARGRQGAYTDIYALAATLYRAITGEKPPEGSWRVAEVAGGDGDPLPPLQEAGYSADFLSAIEAALAVSAVNRPQNIAEWRKMFNFSAGAEAQTESAQQPTQEAQSKKSPDSDSDDFFGKTRQEEEPQNAEAQYELGEKYYYGIGVKQNYQKAIEWLRKAAEQGHVKAQLGLGEIYYSGLGVEKSHQDYQESKKWLLKAAEQGSAKAQIGLSEMYCNGLGVEKDYQEAKKWLLKAAEQGDATAQIGMGFLYEEGLGVEKDEREAEKWYRKAADQGDVDARIRLNQSCTDFITKVLLDRLRSSNEKYALGKKYYHGDGVEQSYQKAVECLTDAAWQGHVRAQIGLGEMYYKGLGVYKNRQDIQAAKTWFLKAAEQGNPEAQFFVGMLYYEGRGVKKDKREAAKWYRKAADQGHVGAKNELDSMRRRSDDAKKTFVFLLAIIVFVMYVQGPYHADSQYKLGLKYYHDEASYDDAAEWLRKSAEQGHADAQYGIGLMYRKGLGVRKDDQEAAKWYQKAAEQGNFYAQNAIGWMYLNGRGVKQDDQEAAKWYQKAAEQGYADSQYNLGWMYDKGRGVGQDRRKAIKWYREAAKQGDVRAQHNMRYTVQWRYQPPAPPRKMPKTLK